MNIDVIGIARVCHETNRAYCAALGDYSQPSWADAPAWQIDSAVEGVRAHLRNGGMTPEESHAAWLAHKEADGWTFGPVKDPVAKQHPCMLPYVELPEEQRVKDVLFAQTVALLAPYLPASQLPRPPAQTLGVEGFDANAMMGE